MCTCRETVFVAVDEHNVRLHPAIPGKHNGPIRPPSGVDCFREVYFAGWLWCSFTGSGISVGITDSQLSRLQGIGGEGGIRTLDRVVRPYNGLANRRLQPLGHLSRINTKGLTSQALRAIA